MKQKKKQILVVFLLAALLTGCQAAGNETGRAEEENTSDAVRTDLLAADDASGDLPVEEIEEMPQEETVDEESDSEEEDNGISQVGTIVSYYEEVYSEDYTDTLLTLTDLKWLQVDERFEGAEEINRCLSEYQENIIAYEEQNAEEMKQIILEYEEQNPDEMEQLKEENGNPLNYYCSYSSTIDEITYFDEKYVSFCQKDYEYLGGAHGMPIWTGFTFDLETGERL